MSLTHRWVRLLEIRWTSLLSTPCFASSTRKLMSVEDGAHRYLRCRSTLIKTCKDALKHPTSRVTPLIFRPSNFSCDFSNLEIKSSNDCVSSREALAQLSKLVESRGQASDRNMIFNDLSKLMERLNLMLDSAEFNLFYDFVFFICRENGQKNLSLTIAVKAWRLVLKGRFRLLNQWCDFVEKHYRYNISEDTWQQLLVFSRCVHENLKGYDPKGSWPVLIDDFVEHMHRITGSNCCPSTQNFFELVDMETQMECGSLAGLGLHSGSKRKSPARTYEHEFETLSPYKSKRSWWTSHH